MTTQPSSSSSSSSSSFIYDVFLSFYGVDTRYDFAGNLLKALTEKGIRTFGQDKELAKGDGITPELTNAIKRSRIAVIVLSKNYAVSSLWLEVLVSILDSFQGDHWRIIPVFHEVNASDVRHQRGTYGEAFANHEVKFKDDMEKVKQWRNALRQVANISSWDGNELEFIEKIVNVSRKFDNLPLQNAEYVVELDYRLEKLRSMLGLGYEGVVMVGICGMGGSGKTTLAQAMYYMIADQFEASCFLPHVSKTSDVHGLVHLQNMLLSEMIDEKDSQIGNIDEGVSIIKQKLHRKKVLLILDDVDRREQFEALAGGPGCFGEGSRVIIVTIGDRGFLRYLGIKRIYDLNLLNVNDVLELLSRQAYKHGNFDPSYMEVLYEALPFHWGNPVVLKVIGSYMVRKSVEEWKKALHRFRRIGDQTILKTVFDELEKDTKSIFLDIACFFNRVELAEVVDILCALWGDNFKFHIQVLIENSLISISSDGKVILHDWIEGMGKKIVRCESEEPGERSRLWFYRDILEVLKTNTGTSKIEIIHLDSPLIEDEEAIEWSGEAFKKMENLRTLIIRKGRFSNAPKYLPDSLRVLEWWRYPSENLPYDFNPNQLVICKLPMKGIKSPKLVELTETSQISSQVLQTSPVVPNVAQGSQRDNLDLQVSLRVPRDLLPIPIMHIFSTDYEIKLWRLVGLISCVIGMAYSICSTGEFIAWRFFIYAVLIMGYLIAILFAEQFSRFVRHVWNNIKQGFASFKQALQSSYQRLETLPVVLDVGAQGSRRALNLQISLRGFGDPRPSRPSPFMQIFSMDDKNNRWRIVGLMSSIVGLSCFALSPSFSNLIGGWNAWKFIFYEVISLVVLVAFLSAEKSSRPVGHVWYKIKGFAILMFVAIYAFYYDKAVDGKPEILSLFSNAAFVVMSLSYSKLTKYAHEMGVFSFFLSCLTVQLWMVHKSLIFVAICFGFPLFVMHSSSDPN